MPQSNESMETLPTSKHDYLNFPGATVQACLISHNYLSCNWEISSRRIQIKNGTENLAECVIHDFQTKLSNRWICVGNFSFILIRFGDLWFVSRFPITFRYEAQDDARVGCFNKFENFRDDGSIQHPMSSSRAPRWWPVLKLTSRVESFTPSHKITWNIGKTNRRIPAYRWNHNRTQPR